MSRHASLLLVALLLAALPRLARADDPALDARLVVPGMTAATADGADADLRNPAGIGFVRGTAFDLDLLRAGNSTGTDAWSVGAHYVAGIPGLAAGLSLRWMRGAGIPNNRRATFTLAAGTDQLALGAAVRTWKGPAALNDKVSYDLGFTARPFSFLSLAATAQDFGSLAITPNYRVGLGLNFLDGRIVAGVDRVWSGKEDPFGGDGRLDIGLHLRVIDGLSLEGTVSQPLGAGSTRVLAGLTLDLAHLGVTGAMPATADRQGGDGAVRIRLSSARYRTLVAGRGMVELNLDDALSGPGFSLFKRGPSQPLVSLVRLLDQMRRDPDVTGVVLRTSGGKLSMASAEDLRQALLRLEHAGKQVAFYLDGCDDPTYYLASVADRVIAAPGAIMLVNGFAASATFYGELLGNLGVNAEYVRVGKYKDAPEEFTRQSMGDAQREVTGALLDDTFPRYLKAVSTGRKLKPADLKATLDRGVLDATAAKQAGLVDAIGYPDQLPTLLASGGHRVRLLGNYARRRYADRPWGGRPVVAVIPVDGFILQGDTPSGPLTLTKATGSDTVVDAVRRAANDPDVAAIILRIDSPGGDAHAADLMWRALSQANRKKPVIASMGSVAASGGYYVAAAARTIVAEPSTITGSIGIFATHFNLKRLYRHLGINVQTILRGKNADIMGTNHPWSDDERKQMQTFVDAGYHLFVSRVAAGRKMSDDAVDAVGRGRVWTGAQAKAHGLVDTLGSFADAVRLAKQDAGIPDDEVVNVAVFSGQTGPLAAFTGKGRPLAFLASVLGQRAPTVPPAVKAALKALGPMAWTLGEDRPLALMPLEVQVR